MATAVAISITGLDPLVEQFFGLETRARDFTRVLDVIANLLESHVAQTFQTQGASSGQPWSPLAPSTVRARTRRWGYYRNTPMAGAGASSPILVWTGRLLRGFARGSGDHIRKLTPTSLRWGTAVPYAVFLHRRRPVLAFRDAFQERELVFQPLRLWLQGVPAGAIETVMRSRQRF